MADFQFGLNTSTIRPASLLEKIKIAGSAGYSAIELWIGDVEDYVKSGGSIADVRKALDDQSLLRPSMISLRDWCVADDDSFRKAKDDAKRRLMMARELSVQRIVAGPPGGEIDLEIASDRYAEILDLSVEIGVPASVEFLGFVKGINTLDKAWKVCARAGRSAGTITPDLWHMFRGGSNPETLDSIPADHISCFHWNDAPANPPRDQQTDADRVYPGDGIYNIADVVKRLRAKGWAGCLSLELFNPSYWKQDLLTVAKTGLAKMKQSVAG